MEMVKIGTGIQHKSLVETIVEDIKQRILSGALKPGERLYEQKLCDEMQVSRSPIREAFRILEAQGFLSSQQRKGVSVTNISAKEAIDIYRIRANLESLAVYLVVKKQDSVLLQKIKEIQARIEEAIEADDFESYFRLNREFHDTIIENCDNPKLIEMLVNFSNQTLRYRYEVLSSPGKGKSSIRNHRELIKSIERGDAEAAEIIRKQEILENIDFINKNFDTWS